VSALVSQSRAVDLEDDPAEIALAAFKAIDARAFHAVKEGAAT